MASPADFSSDLITPTATVPSPYETSREYVVVTSSLTDGQKQQTNELVDKLLAERKDLEAHMQTAMRENPNVPIYEVCSKILVDRYVAERENTLKDLHPK